MTIDRLGNDMTMSWRIGFAALSLALLAALPASANAADNACKALESTDFAGIQDAPTQVMEAAEVAAAGEIPAHCHVQGYVAPQIGFELKLPTSTWNGKFIEIGCGGYCGTARSAVAVWCTDSLRRGYACISSDQGHHSSDGPRATSSALWAFNNLQAEIDYGFRAAHVAALAGRAITERYYGKLPRYSYFMGCSGGGRQGLVEAQRFAWDFDGIIAIDPSNLACTGTTLLWNALALGDSDGKPLLARSDFELLRTAVLKECDAHDGLEDGILGDPRTCRFDPASLTCEAGSQSGCLSAAQVVAVKKVYSGPVNSKGERVSYPAMPGTEGGVFWSADTTYSADRWRYMGFTPDAGPHWRASDFDFDVDYKRLGVMQTINAADNPDLRTFKARGGKLMIVQGWDDSGSPLPLNTVDYYETMQRTMGGRESTQEFARLFMIPGREHCGHGPGANAIDFLGHLEAWVEQGRAPEMMIGAHVQSEDWADFVRLPSDLARAKFTRPHYPYPLQAKYRGSGDPNDYRNFRPVEPKLPAR